MSEEPAYLVRIRQARAWWQESEAALVRSDVSPSVGRAIARLLSVTDALLEEAELLHDRLIELEAR